MTTTAPVSTDDVVAAARRAARHRPPDAACCTPARCPSWSAARSTSSARTCSGPARSRSAARTVRIARLTDEERARGVVAASAGNHAQGVALAARAAGHQGDRVHARGRPAAQGRRRPAATAPTCVLHGHHRGARRWPRAQELADRDRGGASSTRSTTRTSSPARARSAWRSSSSARTCARSWSRSAAAGWPPGIAVGGQAPAPRRPGDRRAGRARSRRTRPRWRRATRSRVEPRRRPWPTASRWAGPGELPFAILAEPASTRCVTVSEESLSRGAAALPGARQAGGRAGRGGRAWPRCSSDPAPFEPPVVVVLSGGNIDPLLLAKVLRHGLAAAGRYLAFRCRLPDRPGRAGHAARRAGRARRQRDRGRARAGRRRPARGRGRGRAPGRDARPGALRHGDHAAPQGRLHADLQLTRAGSVPGTAVVLGPLQHRDPGGHPVQVRPAGLEVAARARCRAGSEASAAVQDPGVVQDEAVAGPQRQRERQRRVVDQPREGPVGVVEGDDLAGRTAQRRQVAAVEPDLADPAAAGPG